ncbi:MAG: hypothetical protein P8X57_12570 [Cyclobacteriaceae bacterium]
METPQPETEPVAVSNGIIFSGDMEGSEFVMASGDEMDHFVTRIEDFNNMDVEAVWTHSADTIAMYRPDGTVIPLTKEGLGEMFAATDSIEWGVEYAVPVEVEGTNTVKILVDGYETLYFKDGTVASGKLYEVFTFEDGKITEIEQWSAEFPQEM